MDGINARHCTPGDIGLEFKDRCEPELRRSIEDYLSHFAAPKLKGENGEHLCLKCNEPLLGFMAALFGKGGFEWGLVHGEGFCRNCHWPARAYHSIKDKDGSTLCSLRNVVLQYHPDFVEARKPAEAAVE